MIPRKRGAASQAGAASTSSVLFGPPPILEGEDATTYDRIIERVSTAVRPNDFIEEIWVRDLVDVIWTILRLRRIQAAYLNDSVSDIAQDDADSEATILARAEAETLKGTEKEQMDRLINDETELSWEELVVQNPRANEIFQELWQKAREDLDMDAIQARVVVQKFDTIERIESLISNAERRYDTIIREMDRHRVILDNIKLVELEKPKMLVQKTPSKKVA